MDHTLSDCNPTHCIRWKKIKEDDDWLLENISVSSSGFIAVSGRNFTTYLTSIDVYCRNSKSRDGLQLCFSRVFEKSKKSERLVSFLEPETYEIVTCCGNRIEVFSIKYDKRLLRLVKGEITCLSVRGTQIFVGLTKPKIIMYNRTLDLIRSISLGKIRNDFMPIDMAATVEKLFICTLSNEVVVCKINETTDTEFKVVTENSLIARSLTISIKLGLVAVLWGNNKIGIYSLTGHNSMLMINSGESISRIRISDSGKLATGNRNTGEVKLYEVVDLFTYHHLKQHLLTQIQTNDCKRMANFFNIPKNWTDDIIESDTPAESFFLVLEMQGIIHPDNVERVTEALRAYNISYSHHLLDLYQKTRKQATSYGRFLATLSTHLTGFLTQMLCMYFCISNEATTKILSTNNPGLSLLLTLDEIGEIDSSDVGRLQQPFADLKLVQAVAKIDIYQLTVKEKIRMTVIDLQENKMTFIEICLRNKIKEWYDTMTPQPWKKSCKWKAADLFVNIRLTLTNSKTKRILTNIDEHCKLEYYEIVNSCRLKAEKRIILSGGPGSGKTMMSFQLAYDWSQGKISEIDNLFILPLKFAKSMELKEAIHCFYFDAYDNVSLEDIECLLTSEVLNNWLILDGLKEYNWEEKKTAAEPSELMQVMQMLKYPNCKVMLTCRPNYAKEFPICPLLQIENISEYLQHAYIEKLFPFDFHYHQDMLRIINDNPPIHDICKVPLLFALTCHTLNSMSYFQGNYPDRLSVFFEKIVRFLCSPEKKEDASDEVGIIDDSRLALSEFAYNGLCRGREILSWQKYILESKITNLKQFLDDGILILEDGIPNGNARKLKEKSFQKSKGTSSKNNKAEGVVRANKGTAKVTDAFVAPLNTKNSSRKKSNEYVSTRSGRRKLEWTDGHVSKNERLLKDLKPSLLNKRKCLHNGQRTVVSGRAGKQCPELRYSKLEPPFRPEFIQSESASEAGSERIERQTSSSSSTAKYVSLEVKFVHKHIQEWFASIYLSHLLFEAITDNARRKLLHEVLPQISPIDLQYVLVFTSYLCPPSCHLIMEFLLQSHCTADGNIPEHIMNCVCLCFAEYSGTMGTCMKNVVKKVCAKIIPIRSEDSRLIQQSKVALMTFAASVGIPIREVHMMDVVAEAKDTSVTFNSGVVFNLFNMIRGIEVSRWDQLLGNFDYANLVTNVLHSKSIRKARFHFPSPPPYIHREELEGKDECDKRVEWLIGPKLTEIFNLKKYHWEVRFGESSTRSPVNDDIETLLEEDIGVHYSVSSGQNTKETFPAAPFKQSTLEQPTQEDCTGLKRVYCEFHQSPQNIDVELEEPHLILPQTYAELLRSAHPKVHVRRASLEHPANSVFVPDGKKKKDLQDQITSAKQHFNLQCQPAYDQNYALLGQIFLDLSGKIGTNWRMLGIRLGLTMENIDHITEDNSGCRERIYTMFEFWRKKKGSKATVDALITALEREDRTDLAEILREISNKVNRTPSEEPKASNKVYRATSEDPKGVPNVGNTCFVSSGVQMLKAAGLITLYQQACGHSIPVMDAICQLMESLREDNQERIQRKRVHTVMKFVPHLNDGSQHDAIEFIQAIFRSSCTFCNSRCSFLTSTCSLEVRNTIRCTICFHEWFGESFDYPVVILPPLSGNVKFLVECLQNFFEAKKAEYGVCESCEDSGNISVVPTIMSLPDVLTIQIPRGSSTEFNVEKNQQELIVDETIMVGDTEYKVMAILCHIGNTLNSGHYKAILRGRSRDRWVLADDHSIEYMYQEEALISYRRDVCGAIYRRHIPQR